MGERHDFERVRNQILQAISQGEATGVAVAVVYRGKIVWEEAFGWANRETGVKATPRTPFSLASCTKPFTTTMFMTLVAEGKVALDEPANKYLANAKIEDPSNENADGPTVRQLGAHASGLPRTFQSYFQEEAKFVLSPNTLLRQYGKLAYPPASVYEYSNLGFLALGEIASDLTGTDLGTLMTQRVLTPLGLHDSFFEASVEQLTKSAVRYDGSGNPIPFYTTSTPSSGELYASAHDLAQFAMFNMKNHVTGQSQILNDQQVDELHEPVFVGPSGVAMTFGWASGHLKSGVQVIFKGGGQAGVATLLYMIPSEKLACLVLSNRSDTHELTQSVCNQILASYLPEWTRLEENAGPAPAPFVATPNISGRWEGTLTGGDANMRVRLEIESSDSAMLALGDNPAEKITEIKSEGTAFTGVSVGSIESSDAIRVEARKLSIKLTPYKEKLVGRIVAATDELATTGFAMLPYVVALNRTSR